RTRPPLMAWRSAARFTVTGPTEHARVWPALAGLGTVAATGALGALWFGESAGIGAALILATSAGFFVESRLLRADMVLVLAITLALYCYVRLRRGGGVLAAVGFWASIGLGTLDKGLVALALPGGMIVAAEAAEGVLRPRTLIARLRALHAPLGAAVLLVLAGPWHALAALHNPGFLWDYTVNQHVLFFFDRKLPRDSIPDSLGFFLAMFLVRGLPWSLFFPAAGFWAYRTARDDPARTPAVGLIAAWVAVVLGLLALPPGPAGPAPARRHDGRHGAPAGQAPSPPRDGDRRRGDGRAPRPGAGRPRTRRGALLVAAVRGDDPRARSSWRSRLLSRLGRV